MTAMFVNKSASTPKNLLFLKKYHDLPSIISYEDAAVVFVSREAMHRFRTLNNAK
jgi:hypothetical protein